MPLYANALTFSPDSRYLLVDGFTRDPNGNFQGTVQIRQMPSSVLVRQFSVPAWVDSVFWTHDLKTVGAGCGQATITDTAGSEIWFWEAATGKLQNRLTLRGFTLRSLAISPNGVTLAVGGVREEAKRSGEIRLLNARTGRQTGELSHSDRVCSVAFSPNGKTLLSLSGQSAGNYLKNFDARLWNVQTQTELRRFPRPHGTAQSRIVFSPNGALIATGDGPEGDVLLWETQTGKPRPILKGHTSEVYGLAFSPNAKRLFTGSRDGTVRVWSLPDGACTDVLKEHPTAVHGLAVSPNGQFLASGDIKNNLVLWQIGT